MNNEQIKWNIKMCRGKAGLTQTDVANALGISRQAYNKFEKNPTAASIRRLVEVAEIIGCSPYAFFKDADSTN